MISNERLEEIRDYDTCVTLKESAEMAERLLRLKPIYQERRFHVRGNTQTEYWAEIDSSVYKYVPKGEKRVVYLTDEFDGF